MTPPRIHRNELGIFIIDIQPTFLKDAFEGAPEAEETLLVRVEHLLRLADWLELPTICTFEKPIDRHGMFPERLEAVCPEHAQHFVKNYFGSMSEHAIRTAVQAFPGKQIAVAGAETDVCVIQSVLGLLGLGFQVFLLKDCLFTTETEPGPALQRMYSAGAIPATVKMLAYELVECVDNVAWYDNDALETSLGRSLQAGFVPPESWPEGCNGKIGRWQSG